MTRFHGSRRAFGFATFSFVALVFLSRAPLDAAADIELTLTITPLSANIGDTVTYELRIRNLGPDATQANQFTITNQLGPDIFAPDSIQSTAGDCTLGAAGENYRCVFPRFDAGADVRVTIIGRAIAAGSRLFPAALIPADDPNTTNNVRTVRLTVQDPGFCTDCRVGEITCDGPVARRLDGDCLLDTRFTDIWSFEAERAGAFSIELRAPLAAGASIRVRDAGCREIAAIQCVFDPSGSVTCRFNLQAGRHFILAGARVSGTDYELAVDCGGARGVACSVDAGGGVAVAWTSSPLNPPGAPTTILVNGNQAAVVPGGLSAAALPAAALGAPADGVAEICVVDSSGRPACCGVFLGDELALNAGGARLDAALGTGLGDGRVWLEDSAESPSPFSPARRAPFSTSAPAPAASWSRTLRSSSPTSPTMRRAAGSSPPRAPTPPGSPTRSTSGPATGS
jgi:uncharacterized repeat protein (TIGR01451 family)